MWYSDATLVRNFCNVLIAAGTLEDTDDVSTFMNQPQRYTEFYTAWEAAGFPVEDDDNWDEFVELVSSDDESDEDDDEDDSSETE